ncbi:ParA family protein [Amycolatopsis magusensis]|uniref:ParA family protein n=1 Tax=Amycolatopsis magusensis TaxID=882444 RepID=UPI0037B2B6CD
MTAPIITFFNNKGGLGKTSLVYHIAWMLAEIGKRVVVADLDPQANLTSAFLREEQVEQIWLDGDSRATIWGAVRPLQEGEGPVGAAPLVEVGDERLQLIPGDLTLSSFEDELSGRWAECLDRKVLAFRITTAFWTILAEAADRHEADVVLVDVGPGLGAMNRAVLVASDYVVIPVAADVFSLQGLRNLGPRLRGWREGWEERKKKQPASINQLPTGRMDVLGYIVMGHGVRLGRPVQAYERWVKHIPGEFRASVLDEPRELAPPVAEDPYCLAQLKHYRSLIPLGQEAHKPIFALKAADGAFGGHFQAAQRAYQDFRGLTERILQSLATHDFG